MQPTTVRERETANPVCQIRSQDHKATSEAKKNNKEYRNTRLLGIKLVFELNLSHHVCFLLKSCGVSSV